MKSGFHALTLMAVVLLTACASGPQRVEGEFKPVDQYMRYDQGSVGSINFFGRFDGFKPVDRDKLLVWDGVDNAYLISVAPPCHDLETTTTISFTQRVRGTINSGLDEVRMPGERCRITEIRRIDYRKMKEDEKKNQ